MYPIEQLFKEMIERQASDLHLSANSSPLFRIHGSLVASQHPQLSGEQIFELVEPLLSEDFRQTFLNKKNLDFGFASDGLGRFRGNLFIQAHGVSAVFRAIPTEIQSLQKIGAPDILYQIAGLPNGLVLVTGPTGSGKTTTLAALINHINQSRPCHIITIEDPIEFTHTRKKALISQREVGTHTHSFADALKGALREDPDVILVGELRDLETISLAITAAETGHLVIATMHTNSAPKTIDRIIDSFPGESKEQTRMMLSESLRAVISQRLLVRTDGRGRVAAYEILLSNRAVSNLIREGKTFQIRNSMLSGRSEGMRLLDTAIGDLYKQGVISGDVAYEHAEDRTPYASFAPKSQSPNSAPAASHQPVFSARPTSSPTPIPAHSTTPPDDTSAANLSPLERLRRMKKPA